VALKNANRLTKCVYQGWRNCHNFDVGDSGGIWCAWDRRVWDCNVISKSPQQISLFLSNIGGMKCYLTLIYGENIQSRRELLWQDLTTMEVKLQHLPWLVSGDFNTARYSNEKRGGGLLILCS